MFLLNKIDQEVLKDIKVILQNFPIHPPKNPLALWLLKFLVKAYSHWFYFQNIWLYLILYYSSVLTYVNKNTCPIQAIKTS